MSESETSTGSDSGDDFIVPEDSSERIALGLGMLGQLLEDIDDDGFWNDPDWEKKNPRDENGMPIKD